MTNDIEKAKPFFDRAEQVEATDNFDYAIDMYIEGLTRAPDALNDGHIPLRHTSFVRQGKGGKKPSMVDKMKHRGGKTPAQQMLNAEYLLAKDPDNLEYIQAMVKAAVAGKFMKTAEWIADLMFDAAKASKKVTATPFLMLKDAYSDLELYDKAVQACSYAVKIKPEDGQLADELKYLSANMAMRRGKYEEEGDFRKMMKDRQGQEKLQAQSATVKSEEYRTTLLHEAQREHTKDPDNIEKIRKLASAMGDLATEASTRQALSLLHENYKKTNDFALKKLSDEIKIKYFKRAVRKARASLEANPNSDKARHEFNSFSTKLLKTDLEYYKGCTENYPTDLNMKYEYGNRLLKAKQFDKAIPMFQESRRDPRRKVPAMDKLGVCFFNKGWYADAIDIFIEAIEHYELDDDSTAKDLRYNLARAYEHEGQDTEALALYRKLAQLDFSYKDVRTRVDKLRASQ